jgi:hypothetical protein
MLGLTSVSILALVAMVIGLTASPSDARPATITLPFAAENLCVSCDVCDVENFLSADFHETWKTPNSTRSPGLTGVHFCDFATCEQHGHEIWGPEQCDDNPEPLLSAEAMGALWDEARDAEGAELRRLVARSGRRVSLNSERGAVQVVGCNGRVLASLPLSRRQVESLQ